MTIHPTSSRRQPQSTSQSVIVNISSYNYSDWYRRPSSVYESSHLVKADCQSATMFNASQKLLLSSTPSLQLRALLHPPLPLNPRESQNLFNLLTKSFRKHLDKEHGPLTSTPTDAESALTLTDSRAPSHTRRNSHTEKHPADRHLSRVLDNPLFIPLGIPLGRGRQILRKDPMLVFEAAVGKGMMDISSAAKCLWAKKQQIVQSHVSNVQDGMRDSKAGTTVLKWLISSGQANNLDFLRNEEFSVLLMQYMIAEGMQDACWAWIMRSFKEIPHIFALPLNSDERQRLKKDIMSPFYFFLSAISSRPHSLDAAYVAMSRAAGYLDHLSLEQARDVLGGPVCFIISLTKAMGWDRPPASETNYNSFLRLIPTSRPRFKYDLAHLWLLHPTRPSVDLALEMLREVHTYGAPLIISQSKKVNDWQVNMDNRIMGLGFEAAKYLLKHDRYREADEIMACLRLHFSTQLGLEPRQQEKLVDSEAEAASLEMLDNLKFA
ncbi:hypothetical protein LSUB1_G004948 [Lachnellula subtilissima]|uniref:Uncharacterized protein n=1 Tax=Lachnellula subtilissima TaxID=602034 RepID=A0A8H8UBI9_9HELO|nr:hypothetical protein LSUB1_G004948 [Lachnellula subtilissima]